MNEELDPRYGQAHEVARKVVSAVNDFKASIGLPIAELPDTGTTENLNVIADGVIHAWDNALQTPEENHANWVADLIARGWVHGDTYDIIARTHPALVAYADLPIEYKTNDFIFLSIIKANPYLALVEAPPAPIATPDMTIVQTETVVSNTLTSSLNETVFPSANTTAEETTETPEVETVEDTALNEASITRAFIPADNFESANVVVVPETPTFTAEVADLNGMLHTVNLVETKTVADDGTVTFEGYQDVDSPSIWLATSLVNLRPFNALDTTNNAVLV